MNSSRCRIYDFGERWMYVNRICYIGCSSTEFHRNDEFVN